LIIKGNAKATKHGRLNNAGWWYQQDKTSSLLIFKNSFQADALSSCGLRLWFLAISIVAQLVVLHQFLVF